jgi:hypothetical protein
MGTSGWKINPTGCKGIGIDIYSRLEYNDGMARKKRTDRNHLLYRLTEVETGKTYIGLTVMRGRAQMKTLETRFQQHCYRAEVQDKDWTLCKALRKGGEWVLEVLEVVRGKAEAHTREVELIEELAPELNTLKKTLHSVGLS